MSLPDDIQIAAEKHYESEEYKRDVRAMADLLYRINGHFITVDVEGVLVNQKVDEDETSFPGYVRRPLANEMLFFLCLLNRVAIWTACDFPTYKDIVEQADLYIPHHIQVITRETCREKMKLAGIPLPPVPNPMPNPSEDVIAYCEASFAIGKFKIPSLFGVHVHLDDAVEWHQWGCNRAGRPEDASRIFQVIPFEIGTAPDKTPIETHYLERGLLQTTQALFIHLGA